jgi:hypothetical protein
MVSLSGVVTGLWGRPVNGAFITLKSVTKRYTDYTELDGSYIFEGVDADTYVMTVEYWLYEVYPIQITLEVDTIKSVALVMKTSIKVGLVVSALAGAVGTGYAIARRLKQK